MFELGVPLYVAGRLAEERSAHIRLEARSQWPESVPALLAAHVSGSVGDTELAGQFRARGLPPPVEKAVGHTAGPRPALPMDWWLDQEREPVTPNGEGAKVSPLGLVASEPETVTSVVAPIARLGPTLLEIHTMGRIEILEADEDLSTVMLSRPVLAFLWLYLLVRALLNPRDRVMRTELADELTPGLATEKQRKRLTDRLWDLHHGDLPKPLADRVVIEQDDSLRLDLTRCTLDFVRLQTLAMECAGKNGLLTPDLAEEAARMLDAGQGEFLPGWDQLESEVTGGRGTAGDMVRDLRQRAEVARVNLLGAMAANYLDRREPARAVQLLEQALERQPEREDLARKLRAAYIETGQTGRAAAIERTYALDGGQA
ncbi:MAG: bacterial transcriptional activator domain-containing protein [Candidatus Dormibacteria bacterium]